MASIQQREKNGRPSYTAKIRLRGHKPVFATFHRLTDAKKWATQTEAAIREGRYFKTAEAQKHTVKDLVERYCAEVLPQKPRSAYHYQIQLSWWKEKIGHILLFDLTPSLINEYRTKLVKHQTLRGTVRSPSTVNRYLAALSSACTTAVKEWEWMEENPVLKVSKLQEPRGRIRYLDDNEREVLLTACKGSSNPNLYTAVALALGTGARQMEVWGLSWRDIDLQRGFITLMDTKNQDPRSIPLRGHALELVKEKSKVRRLDTNRLFPSKKNPLNPFDFRVPFVRALKEAGIEDFRWHDLRHSCASYLAMEGVPIRTIAEILGHRTLQMVQRYTHLSPEHLAEAVGNMNKTIFGEGSQ